MGGMKALRFVYKVCLVFILPFIVFSSCKKKESAGDYKRIVSLSPAGSEILCAVGAEEQIVARTDFCNYPQSLLEKPSVGGFSGETLSVETILFYKPDFVYGTAGIHDSISQLLEQAGVPVYLSKVNSVQDVLNEIAVIGSLTGHGEEALLVYQKMQKVFAKVKEITDKAEKPRVYYEVWSSPFMSVGNKSYIADLIETAGGINVFSDVNDEYPLVSEEEVLVRLPQVIIIPDMNGESKVSISRRHGWSVIPAVKEENIYFAKSDVFSRPGPRMTEALIMIAQMIHPELDFTLALN